MADPVEVIMIVNNPVEVVMENADNAVEVVFIKNSPIEVVME